jgi:hypothetical protein
LLLADSFYSLFDYAIVIDIAANWAFNSEEFWTDFEYVGNGIADGNYEWVGLGIGDLVRIIQDIQVAE